MVTWWLWMTNIWLIYDKSAFLANFTSFATLFTFSFCALFQWGCLGCFLPPSLLHSFPVGVFGGFPASLPSVLFPSGGVWGISCLSAFFWTSLGLAGFQLPPLPLSEVTLALSTGTLCTHFTVSCKDLPFLLHWQSSPLQWRILCYKIPNQLRPSTTCIPAFSSSLASL